jgi:phosphohistidine phosphatase
LKHLLLLRHAKAEAGGHGMADRDRRLAERGHRDARLMGSAIAAGGIPDLILCSPARRTRETLDGVIETLAASPKVEFVKELYGSEAGIYLGAIADHGNGAKRLLVIGHNPTVHATAMAFAATGDKSLRAALASKFPTCSLAVLAFEGDGWSDLRVGSGKLVSFLRPRDLGVDADD